MKNWKDKIIEMRPCKDGLNWALSQNTIKDVWDNCERGDWLLWLAFKLNIDKRKLTIAKGCCAKTVIHLMTDQRSKDAVQAAIDYENGLIDDEELNTVAAAVAASAVAASAAAAAAAVAVAAATDDNADAAFAVVAFAAAAAAFAADDAANDARKTNLKLTANICKEHLTEEIYKIIELW